MIKITSWALVLGALASSTAAGFVNRQPTAVFNLTSPLGRSFLSDSPALRARGDLPSGSGCNFDADCSTGWCSFDFEIGNNAYVNYASKTCKPMPYSGPCSSSSQCSTGNCDSTSSTCAYANDPARTCTYNTDCESQFCSNGICSLNGGDACRNDVPCGYNGCNSFASPQPTCTRQPVRNSCLRNAQCINNVCGTGTSTYNCGFSLQADGSILRSERCWRSDYCRFAGIGTSCDLDYYGGDCTNRFNLDCDTDTNMCSLGLAGFRCYSGSECLSNVCGQSPYPQLGSSGVCIALPAGSPCILNRQCGSSVCDSGTGKCAVGEVGSRCFFNHDCSNSVCDTESSFTCVVPVSTTTIATSTATSTTSTSSSTSSTALSSTTTTSSPTSTSTSTPTTSSTSTSTSSTTTSKPVTTSLVSSTSSSTTTTSKPATTSKASTTSSSTTVTTSKPASTSTSASTTKSTTSSSSSTATSGSSTTTKPATTSASTATSKSVSTSKSSSSTTSKSSTLSTTSKSTTSVTTSKPTSTSTSSTTSKSTSTSTKTTPVSSSTSRATMTTTKSSTIISTPTPTKTVTTTTTKTTTKTTTTTTAVLLPLGALCSTSPSCQSGYCRAKLNPDGTRASQANCDVKKASGANCYQNAGCVSGTCLIAKGDVNGVCK